MSSRRVVECDTRRKNWDSSSLKTAASSWHSESCWPLLERGSSTTAVKRERNIWAFFFLYHHQYKREWREKTRKETKEKQQKQNISFKLQCLQMGPSTFQLPLRTLFSGIETRSYRIHSCCFDIIFIAPLLHITIFQKQSNENTNLCTQFFFFLFSLKLYVKIISLSKDISDKLSVIFKDS